MPDSGNGSRFISFKIMVGALASLLLLLVVGVITDTRSGISEAKTQIECLQREKVNKDQYRQDVGEIKQALRDINVKLDRMR